MRNSQVANPIDSARRRFVVQYYHFHAFDPKESNYLHLSGKGRTKRVEYAWSGTEAQFERLKLRVKDTEEFSSFCRLRLVSLKSRGVHDMGFQSQKENLEDFFNE